MSTEIFSPQGQELIAQFFPYEASMAMARSQKARRDHPAELVAQAMTQAKLRTRAVQRLGPIAEKLMFTAEGLEQATRPDVAALRARHFADHGATRIADIGCGLGFDSIAFAQAGLQVIAIEADPISAEYAKINAQVLELDHLITIMVMDAHEFVPADFDCDAVFVDPARRSAGKRIKDPSKWGPSWSTALALAQATPMGCLKVAPGIDHELPPAGSTTQWVSHSSDLVEACVWLGTAATAAIARKATILPAGITLSSANLQPVAARAISTYLLEPDDAVIRSGLVGIVADQTHAGLIDPAIAYLTTDQRPPASALYAAFEVLEAMPFSLKGLRQRVRELGIGQLEIKKRGSAVDPEKLRTDLKLEKSNKAAGVIVLTRIGLDPIAIIAKRLA